MATKDAKISKFLEKKLMRQARRMTNEELREGFWIARKNNEENLIDEQLKIMKGKNIIMEKIFTEELKRRELLEWALRKYS